MSDLFTPSKSRSPAGEASPQARPRAAPPGAEPGASDGARPALEGAAGIATQIYTRRRATAQRKVAEGALGPAEAERHLRPWLALAIRAGADPATIEPHNARWFEDMAAPYCEAGFTTREIAAVIADEICLRPQAIATLVGARDIAMTKALAAPTDREKGQRAHELVSLSIYFGAGLQPRRKSQKLSEAA